MKKIIVFLAAMFIATNVFAASITNPWDAGHYDHGTNTTTQTARFDDLFVFGASTLYGPVVLEGATLDAFQTVLTGNRPHGRSCDRAAERIGDGGVNAVQRL